MNGKNKTDIKIHRLLFLKLLIHLKSKIKRGKNEKCCINNLYLACISRLKSFKFGVYCFGGVVVIRII